SLQPHTSCSRAPVSPPGALVFRRPASPWAGPISGLRCPDAQRLARNSEMPMPHYLHSLTDRLRLHDVSKQEHGNECGHGSAKPSDRAIAGLLVKDAADKNGSADSELGRDIAQSDKS